jgi:hypothetical protein
MLAVRERTRAKVSVTVQRSLLRAVDAYVGSHQGVDRSKVFDEALHDWYAKRQEEELFEFYSTPEKLTPEQAAEYAAWAAIRGAAAERVFRRPDSRDA